MRLNLALSPEYERACVAGVTGVTGVTVSNDEAFHLPPAGLGGVTGVTESLAEPCWVTAVTPAESDCVTEIPNIYAGVALVTL